MKNPSSTPIIADCAGFTDTANNIAGWSYSFIIPNATDPAHQQSRAIKYLTFANGVPTGENKWVLTAARTTAAKIKANQHGDGANYVFADGHAKWLHYALDPEGLIAPPRAGLDYNSDGVLGDDTAAGTGGKYD